eukprot:6212304-Pleurochrysis_carterae.AAC.4
MPGMLVSDALLHTCRPLCVTVRVQPISAISTLVAASEMHELNFNGRGPRKVCEIWTTSKGIPAVGKHISSRYPVVPTS